MSGQHSDGPETAPVAYVPKAAKREGDPVAEKQKLQPSVSLSVGQKDRTILTAIIDRTASQTKILNDLRQQLSKFAVPYRDLDQRILEAIRVKFAENLSYEEAAIYVFGDAKFARKIRYWQNRWQLQ